MTNRMINWIEYTADNAAHHELYEPSEKVKYVYLNSRGLIAFSKDILTTHFALKSEYEAILPKEAK